MSQQIFSDGIGQVSVIAGTVRLDFVAFSPTEKDAKGQPAAAPCQRVVMTVDAFLSAAAKIQEAAQAISRLASQRARPAEAPPAEPAPKPFP